MAVTLGVSGVGRNATAAICVDGAVHAACEQERVTRKRGAGFEAGRLPDEAIDMVLASSGHTRAEVSAIVVSESDARPSGTIPVVRLAHHRAHAATAFLTSPFERALVLVCDGSPDSELSVWIGDGRTVVEQDCGWQGRAFATLYAECAEVFGFAAHQEHRLEALARLGHGDRHAERLDALGGYDAGTLRLAPDWKARLSELVQDDRAARNGFAADAADAVQRWMGRALLAFCGELRSRHAVERLCVGGGLFFNTFFNTLLQNSGLFDHVFVPINPGNAGLAVGGALLVAAERGESPAPVSPFLGPEYGSAQIKAVLDSCKLSYSFVSESDAIDAAVRALTRGQLVGWFHGRMEWGPRALGHRSILADCRSEFALDNLNCYLRKRERWWPFGVSALAESAGGLFCGPAESSRMEFEYVPRTDGFRHVMPAGARVVRVQTVSRDRGPFWQLHKRVEEATGTGALVNTSFNAFREPIVCDPRDAVRVFYGTGLDLLVIGRFVLTK